MTSSNKILQSYDYSFPSALIAQAPASPRDSAKLLVYNRATKTTEHDVYKNILNYLPKNGVLVLNQTKVLPARITVTKPTGGKARLLYIKHDNKHVWMLSDRKLEIDSEVSLTKSHKFTVLQKTEQGYVLKPYFKTTQLFSVLQKHGATPLPPYIKHSPLTGKKLLTQYNTVFAKELGSVAAPTASLHFTKALLKKISSAGIDIKYVTLHVNLGTFASLTDEHLRTQKLHEEYYEIDKTTASFLNKAKKMGRPIIAVGTTVVRTLESAATTKHELTKLSGTTQLFINEKSTLKFVDMLATNFHVPQSSLLMLVSSFTGRKELLKIYKEAISKKYRLFSFGDGMLVQ